MREKNHFNDFLEKTVNLNATKVSSLETSVDAIKDAVREIGWGVKIKEFRAQGSWAHKTIIKPPSGKTFDADLLVFVDPVEGWEPKDYVNKLATELGKHHRYANKVERSSHCATVVYAGDKRIDVAPCIKGRLSPNTYEVCNRNSNEFEQSEPIAYTQWVRERNAVIGSNDLIKTTRLLKYLRDIKQTFSCPSFLFTTLLGLRVYDGDKGSSAVEDLPTTLKTMVNRLDDWLQMNHYLPEVRNPVLYGENQASGWTQEKYTNFRNKIHQYRGWIDDAYEEADADESIGKWRRVFGEDFASSYVKARAENVSASMVVAKAYVAESFLSRTCRYGYDLVSRVKAEGSIAIPSNLRRLPHVERPQWRNCAADEKLNVTVRATVSNVRNSSSRRDVESAQPLTQGHYFTFTAFGAYGQPFDANTFEVKWQVVNTDKQAAAAECLRGQFHGSDFGFSRQEHTEYRGVHFVRAYLVRKRDNRLMGVSEPFYVVVESSEQGDDMLARP